MGLSRRDGVLSYQGTPNFTRAKILEILTETAIIYSALLGAAVFI
jgi:hypothetical protein